MTTTYTNLERAKRAFLQAITPDKTYRNIISAGLDGTGKTPWQKAGLQGLKEDVFEVGPKLVEGSKALLAAIRE